MTAAEVEAHLDEVRRSAATSARNHAARVAQAQDELARARATAASARAAWTRALHRIERLLVETMSKEHP